MGDVWVDRITTLTVFRLNDQGWDIVNTALISALKAKISEINTEEHFGVHRTVCV